MMDMRRGGGGLVVLALVVLLGGVARANVVFNVQHKFGVRGGRGGGNGRKSGLAALKAHDAQRHRRMLAAVDFQLGGNGLPNDISLYYAKLSIGTPPKDYYVQVDTGSDILWLNCAGCDKCPRKSGLGRNLTWYDLKASSTGKPITCDQEFCSTMTEGPHSNCKAGMPCEYSLNYADGSQTAGYYVRDNFRFEQVSENSTTSAINGSIAFGCSTKQVGELASSTKAVDGIVGFGQANSSIISQLATSGKVKKVFSHCLDSRNGGGIFAIGQVMQPKLKTTPLVPNQPHYNVKLKAIEVGGGILDVPKDTFDTESGGGTIFDSGTTLAYFPDDVYDLLMAKVMAKAYDLNIHTVGDHFKCFYRNKKVAEKFPVVTFHFENSVTMDVYPRDYLFQLRDNEWCIGWQKKALEGDGSRGTLLGDMVLSNKLIVYDLENQTIGWAENYNCSSSIQVKDEGSGKVYSVAAHDLSFACSLNTGKIFAFFLLISMLWNLIE